MSFTLNQVQQAYSLGSTVTSVTCSITAAANHLILVGAVCDSSSTAISSVTDSNSTTYNVRTSGFDSAFGSVYSGIYDVLSLGSGITSVTVTAAASITNFLALKVWDFTPTAAASFADATNFAVFPTLAGTDNVKSRSLVVTSSDALFVGFGGTKSGGNLLPGTGPPAFTDDGDVFGFSPSNNNGEHLFGTASSPVYWSDTMTGDWVWTSVAAYQIATAGGDTLIGQICL